MSTESSRPEGTDGHAGTSPAAAPGSQSLASRIGKVRHDLHNPLSDILGFSELLQEEAQAQRHFHLIPEFQAIHQAATVILKQVNQTLDLEQLQADPRSLDQLREVTSSMFDRIMSVADSLSQKCVLLEDSTFGDDLLRITGSTRNLMEFMPGLLSLMTAAESSGGVRGEAGGDLPAGATEFFEAPREPGPGAGSQRTPDTEALGRQAAAALERPAVLGSLLVVEDNETNRVLLTRRLRRQGHTVSVAENGRQALRLLRTRPFDLVLLDIMMPEMNGYEVLEEIKSDPALRHLPVIMISGLDELESLVRCIERGAEDYLPKPFDPVLLRARIGATLEKKRLRDQEQVHLRQLQEEQDKSERLLLSILPRVIAQRMKQGEQTIADSYTDVTILFADLVGFTPLAFHTSATDVVRLLNEIVSAFDLLADKHGLEKVKTSGDSYMAVAGLPTPRPDHAEAVAEFALDLLGELDQLKRVSQTSVRMRVGIHTGPVVAGIIGRNKFIYDLWGDAVNTASRMESQGRAGRIQVSETTYERLRGKYEFQQHGPILVKGRGRMTTYYLIGRKA